MIIYIASNIQIDMWQSVISYIHKKDGTLSFVYPSINESNPCSTNYITVNFLFSKYVFAEQVHKVEGTGSNGFPITEYKRNRIVFSFDDIAVESFQYLWSMFKKFQFTDHLVEKYIFVFFPRSKDDVKFVNDNLIKSLENGITPPIAPEDKDKIQIEFLENRHLSPVDN